MGIKITFYFSSLSYNSAIVSWIDSSFIILITLKSIGSIGETPQRFGLFREEIFLFSISITILKKYFKSNLGKIKKAHSLLELKIEINDLENTLLKQIREDEIKNLSTTMSLYLARQEISPRRLTHWLEKRKLDHETMTCLFELAQKGNFLNSDRFIEYRVRKSLSQAKKPWWKVQKEIEFDLMIEKQSDQERERLKTEIEKHRYQDLDILLNHQPLAKEGFKSFASPQPDEAIDRIKRKLVYRGFSENVVGYWESNLRNIWERQ